MQVTLTQCAGVLFQVLKHEARPIVSKLDTTRTANFVHLSNVTLTLFRFEGMLALKSEATFSRVCMRVCRHSLSINFFLNFLHDLSGSFLIRTTGLFDNNCQAEFHANKKEKKKGYSNRRDTEFT